MKAIIVFFQIYDTVHRQLIMIGQDLISVITADRLILSQGTRKVYVPGRRTSVESSSPEKVEIRAWQ